MSDESEEEVSIDMSDEEDGAEPHEGLEDQEIDLPEFPLSKKIAAKGLSLLAKTGSGLQHAYVRLQVVDKQITDINVITCFTHLRYVDFSENSLKDISPLSSLVHLLTIKADNNLITNATLGELPYLRLLSLSHNRIGTTDGISHPQLHALNLNFNQIETVTGIAGSNPLLDTLELRGNRLTALEGIQDLPSIRKLCLADNAITSLEGLSKLSTLQWLHIRNNKLSRLDGVTADLANLQYMNLRDNNALENVTEVQKLTSADMLRAVILRGCPMDEIEDYRAEVVSYLRSLERLDKETVTGDERDDAAEKSIDRLRAEDAEKFRLEQERLAAAELEADDDQSTDR